MEHGACNVIYVDRRAHDEYVKRETLSDSLIARTSTGNVGQSYFALGKTPPAEVHANVEAILSVFNEGKASILARSSRRDSMTYTIAQYTSAAQAGRVSPKSPRLSTPPSPRRPSLSSSTFPTTKSCA